MKKFSVFVLVAFICSSLFAANPFKDISKDHWAFKAIESLAGKGILDGYPDGSFKGSKNLTRYEAAMMVAKLMAQGGVAGLGERDLATLEKLITEFSDELALIGVKVTALEDQVGTLKNDLAAIKDGVAGKTGGTKMGKIDITGDMRMTIGTREYEFDTTMAAAQFTAQDARGFINTRENDWENEYKIGLNIFANIDEDVTGFVRLRGVGNLGSVEGQEDNLWRATQVVSYDDSRAFQTLQDLTLGVEYAYVDIKNIFDLGDLRLGRQNITIGHNLVYAAPSDAMKFDKVMDQVSLSLMAWDSNVSFFDAYVPTAFTVNQIATGSTINALALSNQAQALENGFNSKAFTLGVDFGGHAVGGYYMTQSYDRYDPFIRNGDSLAVKYGTGNAENTTAGTESLTAYDSAVAGWAMPSADPTWWGLTLDGNVMENLDYFFEYIDYDSDLAAFTTDGDRLAGITLSQPNLAANQAAVVLPGRDLGGAAWLLGFDWDLNDDFNLIAQYGTGDEEFVPSNIDFRQKLNGMMGRFGTQAARTSHYWAPTGSLQGIKDLFLKLSYDFNDKTSGYISYESVRENDSNAFINVVPTKDQLYNVPLATLRLTNAATVGVNYVEPSEYTAFGFGVKHQYRPNTAFTLDYTSLSYDQDAIDLNAGALNTPANGADDMKVNLAPNAGGWQMIKAAVEVKF